MDGIELRAIRKSIAMTQHELADALGVSRKTVIGWEAATAPLDKGVELQVREVAGQIRVVENRFWVDETIDGSYAVVRRRIRDLPLKWAAAYIHGETSLYGVFPRRDQAYRWCSALQGSADPRNTRRLLKQRASGEAYEVS